MGYRKLAYSVVTSPACGTKGSVRLLFVSFHFFTLDKLKIFVMLAQYPEAIAALALRFQSRSLLRSDSMRNNLQ